MAEIKVRWLDASQELIQNSLLAEAFSDISDVKRRALKRLNIECAEGVNPLEAYIRAMCTENGLEYSRPAPSELVDVMMSSGASRFIWFLA